jgi:aspartate racemase
MRTLGILGGLGPESTIDYYRTILARYREITHNREYPHILISSLDADKGIAMLDAGRVGELVTIFLTAQISSYVRVRISPGSRRTRHIWCLMMCSAGPKFL